VKREKESNCNKRKLRRKEGKKEYGKEGREV
jgi:hypothetical protein